ncbi:MAG TPA: hypothetical protein VFG01_04390 [Acidobacteriota bacterium]|nr:hypothetical protein [Acidobacteriota bacterium]
MESQKSSSTKKWLIGCGIGCGAVIIIGIILIVGGVFFIKNMVTSFEESEDILRELTEKYGEIEEYCPSPSGSIAPDRMEAFLKTRELIQPEIKELEQTFDLLSDEQEQKRAEKKESSGVFKKIKTGIGLIPKIAEFLKKRNQALLEVKMGIGEYYYIYTIAYYSWLDKSITDGVPIHINRENEFDYHYGEDEESQEIRRDLAVRRLNKMLLPMLKNQYERLKKTADREISENWRSDLKEEIEAMEKDRYRLVWQDGLPEVIESSLKPYKDRLESSYSSSLNNLELLLEQR